KRHEVRVLARDPERAKRELNVAAAYRWDGAKELPPIEALAGADAVVNLAGASVAGKRWSPEYKKAILDSRVLTTRALVEAIAKAQRKPQVLVNASAVGYYGGRGDEVLEESAGPGADFLADVVSRWEAEAQRASIRSVQVRTGIVLSAQGGALEKMLPPFKAFVGGPIGSGKQWFPWIHIADEVAAIAWCIDSDLTGAVNLAAPGIVTMKEFAKALGRVLHRPSWAPVPAAPLRILLGEFASALLEGQRAVPRKLLDSGFRFRFSDVDSALRDLFA
ncbi:MAG TPA: TIGR01777 family oxidoreductase, partial [Myxococcales bacterium]|nr:TIGR01777 family oxidoreductase [Myxococcales bacterium]